MSALTGGPAFPIPGLHEDSDFNGMTLRDYFAAKAPEAPDDFGWGPGETDSVQRLVRWNYHYADAMLAERVK